MCPLHVRLSSASVRAHSLLRAWQHAPRGHLQLTTYSPRNGWATELRPQSISSTEIKTQGRWGSDKSLLTYLDIRTTMLLQIRLGELAGHAKWLESDLARNFPRW